MPSDPTNDTGVSNHTHSDQDEPPTLSQEVQGGEDFAASPHTLDSSDRKSPSPPPPSVAPDNLTKSPQKSVWEAALAASETSRHVWEKKIGHKEKMSPPELSPSHQLQPGSSVSGTAAEKGKERGDVCVSPGSDGSSGGGRAMSGEREGGISPGGDGRDHSRSPGSTGDVVEVQKETVATAGSVTVSADVQVCATRCVVVSIHVRVCVCV